MGRSEWVLIAVVLSAGLMGATAAADSGHVPQEADTVERATAIPTESVSFATGEAMRGPASVVPGVAPIDRQERGFLDAAQQQFERSTFRVEVMPNGDARWLFRYERPIESDDERSTFERYAERFRTEETDLYREFRNQSDELTTAAAAETDRSMAATEFERDAGIDQTPTQEEGYVELSFRWTEFGRIDGDTIVVGDVFEGGLYLGETQSLIFVAGDGVQFESVDPPGSPSGSSLVESESVTWTGEEQFADRRPRAVFMIDGNGGSGPATDGGMMWLLGGGVIGLLLVATLAFARYGGIPSDHRDGGAATAAERIPSSEESGGSDGAQSDVEPATVQEEPLSDDRRVLQLLEEGGGRLKQTAIVEETGWSKSKVSMLLSEMEDEGRIRKIQVGRENIIALEGHEPEAVSSPFDDRD